MTVDGGEPIHVLITGGSGYIGSRLVGMALDRGYWVTVLGRPPRSASGSKVRAFPWRIGEPVPAAVWETGADCPPVGSVLHLAHDWSAPEGPGCANSRSASLLLEEARLHGVTRFVFASSIAARPTALNRYGRIKAEVEQSLHGPDVVLARIGLVYGGELMGLWGTMCNLVGLAPVLPMICIDRPVQPIHRDDVCHGLLLLAAGAKAKDGICRLAAPDPIAFGRFLELIALARKGRKLWLIGLPLPLILFLVDMLAKIPGLPKIDRERALGLAGVPVVETREDLSGLGLELRDLEAALRQ